MGCSSSSSTAVRPLTAEDANHGEVDGAGKADARGDSAASKGTADSGVVLEGVRAPPPPPPLPGQVVRPLTVTEMCLPDVVRPKSSEILEQLLSQGIIPVGQKSGAAGEAYSIVLDEGDGVHRRRPPPRLESLKAASGRRAPSREQFEEKMRLAERRRKLQEDQLLTRLRVRSARVRVPVRAFGSQEDEEPPVGGVTPVEPIQLLSQVTREEAEGEEEEEEQEEQEEEEEEAGEGRRTFRREAAGAEDGGRGKRSEEEEQEEEEEEETQVEELEKDSSFQRADDEDEIF